MTQINTKLYIVEGPPCSGKSEAARFVAEAAAAGGSHVAVYDENDMDHPADYAFHAFMTEKQIGALSMDERRQIYAESSSTSMGYVFPLTKISVNLFGKVLPHKIYDYLEWESERPVMLENWRSFAEKARFENIVNVFVGSLLKNPVGEMMIRFDYKLPEIRVYIQELYDVVKRLDPAVIYLRSTDIASRIDERSGNRKAVWLSGAVNYHTAQCYGQHRGRSGFDGYVSCLKERQDMELDILDALKVKKLILTDPHLDMDGAGDAIRAFVLQRRQALFHD